MPKPKIPGHITKRAEEILRVLYSGQDYSAYRHKRMHYDSSIIVFELQQWYRLVVERRDKSWRHLGTMTHEEYNHRFARGDRR